MRKTSHVKSARLILVVGLPLILLAALLVVLNLSPTPVCADPGLIYVDGLNGTDQAGCGATPGGSACATVGYTLISAVPGDVVYVAPAVYTETITMLPGVVISGSGAAATIIDGDGTGPVVSASGSSITGSAVLRGLAIRGGNATNGGGLSITGGASPLIDACVVRDNQASLRGGEIYVYQAAPTVRNTVVRDNRQISTGNAYWGGGGFYVRGCSPTISNTLVISNSAEQYGGGVFVTNSGASPVLRNVQVLSSTARRGGGIYIYRNASPSIDGGRVQGNRAVGTNDGDGGGGFYIRGGASPTVSDTLVSNNTAALGGGFFVYDDASPTINGGEVSHNRAIGTGDCDGGGGFYIQESSPSLTGIQVRNNIATQYGGGLFVYDNVSLVGARVISNTAGIAGGGLIQTVASGRVDVTGGRFERNVATQVHGGGLFVAGSVALTGTQVVSNIAGIAGGGLYGVTAVQAVNDLFSANAAPEGAALYLEGLSGTQILRHLTVVSAPLSSGSAVYVSDGLVDVTNAIIVGYTIGISQTGGTLNEDYSLYNNGTNIDSAGGTLNVGANSLHNLDPRFVDPVAGDFHINADSPALDAGNFVDVTVDIDGDTRPAYPAQPDAPDIGCDENKSTTVRRAVKDVMTFGATGARIVFTETGSLSAITVTVVYTYPTGQSSSKPLPRYYLITAEGSGPYSASLALCYTDAEVAQSGVDPADEDELRLYRLAGGWEACASTVDTDSNVITATQVTAFSKWALGGPGGEPTAVELSSFAAEWNGDGVLVAWETALEIDTVGFNLWRGTAPRGPYERINETLIPAASLGSVMGGFYDYVDADVTPGTTYYYKLEEVEAGGARNWYGPVSTGGSGPNAVIFARARTRVWGDLALVLGVVTLATLARSRRRR